MNHQLLASLVAGLLVTPCLAENAKTFEDVQRKQIRYLQNAVRQHTETNPSKGGYQPQAYSAWVDRLKNLT